MNAASNPGMVQRAAPLPAARSFLSVLPYLLLAIFFVISIAARPLLPVDETRYLGVSWEMFVRHSFVVPTMNFEPYFQKPPLLFWLIDVAWGLFGVSRVAAMVVVFAISSTVILLTQRLGRMLFPDMQGMRERTPWVMLGSLIFVVYSSLVLFDLLLTLFVLGATCALVAFSRDGRLRHVVLAGLCVGLGAITKGPVVLIHVACPILLYALWRDPGSSLPTRRFLTAMPLVILVGLIPVLAWLIPLLFHTGLGFAYDLVWRQAAGRLSGSVHGAHARPFYFYVLLLPLALVPWVFSIDLWRSKPWTRMRDGSIGDQDRRIVRFLVAWIVIVIVVFSMISGKQPHYLVPVVPAVALLFAYFMAKIRYGIFVVTTLVMLGLVAAAQIVASFTVFQRYDLEALAQYVAERRDAEWAFLGDYQGQLTFLARMTKPFERVGDNDRDKWLREHPAGYLIIQDKGDAKTAAPVLFRHVGQRNDFMVVGGANTAVGQP